VVKVEVKSERCHIFKNGGSTSLQRTANKTWMARTKTATLLFFLNWETGDFAPAMQYNGDFTSIFPTLRFYPSFSQTKAASIPLCNSVN
jgi:hypothetical protein